MTVDTSLAHLLRGWRQRALLTQEQLARRTGLGVRTVRRLESDGLRRPRTDSVRLLADGLGLTADERHLLISAARTPPGPPGDPSDTAESGVEADAQGGADVQAGIGAAGIEAGIEAGIGADVLREAERALAAYRRSGDRHGEAGALNTVGWHHALLGDYETALVHCQESLSICESLGDPSGAARAWTSIGYAYHHLGQYDLAVASYRTSTGWFAESGDRYGGAASLGRLGDTYLDAGDWDAARQAWLEALETLDDLGHDDADGIRARLTALGRR